MADLPNGVAPIKAEYRRKEKLVLPLIPSEQKTQAEPPACPASQVALEPKSKRQMKKARLQLVNCSDWEQQRSLWMCMGVQSCCVSTHPPGAGAAGTAGSRLVQPHCPGRRLSLCRQVQVQP